MEDIGNLGAVEQPVARLHDLAEVEARLAAPVMADEMIFSPQDAIEVVNHRAASMALIKITKHGGLLDVMRIASVFDAAGLILSVAVYPDIMEAAAAHVAAAIPCVRWPSFPTKLQDSILVEPLEPKGLVLPPPEKPGLGIELDEEKLLKYRSG
jgi:muconate cycloisomerase